MRKTSKIEKLKTGCPLVSTGGTEDTVGTWGTGYRDGVPHYTILLRIALHRL